MALWTPAEIITQLWLDAADSDTITIGTGVSTWEDKSGNDRHATQSTGTKQPVVNSAAINGLDTITFDGTDDDLDLASQPIVGTTPRSFFSVVKSSSVAQGKAVFAASNAPSIPGALWDICPESGQMTVRVSGNALFSTTIPLTPIQYGITWASGNAFSTLFYKNGVSVARSGGSDNTVDTDAGLARIGYAESQGTEWFDGDIAEVIICNTVLSTDDRQLVEGYLAWKWGLEGDLDSGHPYKSAAPASAPPGPETIYTATYYDLFYSLYGTTPTSYYDMIWKGVSQTHYNFYYGDALVATSVYNLYYSSAPVTIKYYDLKYKSAYKAYKYYELLWNIAVPAVTFYDLNYSLTGNSVLNYLSLLWAIRNVDFAESYYNLNYNVISANYRSNAITASVTIAGTIIPFNNIRIERHKEQYFIIGGFTVNNPDYFHLLKRHQPVIISVQGVDYHLIIISKSKQIKKESINYSVTCNSPAVKLNSRETPTLQKEFPADTASNIAKDLAAIEGIELIWDIQHKGAIVDETVRAGTFFANDEKPIAVLRRLVISLGGIIQSRADGKLHIVHKRQKRVPDWAALSPDYVLNDLMSFRTISVEEKLNSGVNAVKVSDQLVADSSYNLEEVEVSATQKEFRGYHTPWDEQKVELTTSGGVTVSISYVGVFEETYPPVDEDPELIEFVEGAGNTSKPIYDIVSKEWVEDNLGAVTFSEDGQLVADVSGESLLAIRYKIKYMKWNAISTQLPEVQFILRAVDE